MAISPVGNVSLSVLQLPEVVREEIPILAQIQNANAQAPAIIRHYDQQAAETVPVTQQIDNRGVPSSLEGETARQRPGYREPARGPKPLQNRMVSLAGAHPRGLGRSVDVRA